jgi:VWFA-related protein
MRILLSVGTCLLLGLATVAAQPQQQQKPQPQQQQAQPPEQKQEEPIQGPTFRTGVDLVAVDVAVVDRRGRPIEDLHAAEFAVKIDGEVRRVVSAELIKVDIESAKREVADKTETFYTSNLTPPQGRQIVIAVDQVNIRPGSLRPVLDAAARFLDMLSPLDQIAFIAYPEPGPRVNFTNDKLRLKRAMQGLVGQQPRARPGTYNIGVSEAINIEERRDQIVLAAVVMRECRSNDPRQLAQCERDIVAESAQITRNSREDADISLRGLQQLLEQLAFVDGPKSLILISEGLATSETNDMRHLVRLAGAARTAINVLSVDLRRGDVTIAEQPPTEAEDRRILMQGLEAIASMSRGSLYHIAGTGEPIFERLASEISAYYLLGVEQKPSDLIGDRHRIDVEVRRNDVTIRSRQAFVLSPSRTAKRSPVESLRDALASPFAISGLPLRVTTFAQQDPGSEKVRLVIAAQVGETGAKPGKFAIGYLVIDDQNRVAASFGDEVALTNGAGSANEPLKFVGGVVVEPGIYSLRIGVVDSEGRRGSVIRDVSAWKMAGESFALGDLIVGPTPTTGQGLTVQVEPYVLTEGVAAYLEMYSTTEQTWNGTTVTFEVADDPDSAALASIPVTLIPGRQPTWRIAAAVINAKSLPPGRYVARAKIARDGKAVGVLARPFVFEHEGGGAPVAGSVAVAAAAVSFASSLPKFDSAAVLKPEMLGPMLDMVEKRSATLKDAITEARAGRYGPAALEAFSAGDQTAAAFLRGIDLYTKGQIDQAATQFQVSAGPRREFFPSAFYLGALFAAAGRDQDAAGVWQIALGTDPRPAVVYMMVADARLRTGQAVSAIDILKPAYERDPAQDEIARRLAMAYSMTGRHADALPVLDNYLSRKPTDQELLYAAIVAQYELARNGQPLSNVDRAKLRKYSAAYKGPNAALVEKYLQTIGAK